MKKSLLLLCFLATAIACKSTQAVSDNKAPQNSNISEVKNEPKSTPTKVSINAQLNSKQTKELDKSLPPNVRDILENAETFEILAEIERKDGKITYPLTEGFDMKPNIKAEISDANTRKEILENFYRDAAKGSEPALCYIPHHILRAKRGDKTVEIEICFSCSRFQGKGSFGEFSGTVGRGDEQTENLFNRIIATNGVEIK
jgi:hypothetical protein